MEFWIAVSYNTAHDMFRNYDIPDIRSIKLAVEIAH